jgi:hypothetical protein
VHSLFNKPSDGAIGIVNATATQFVIEPQKKLDDQLGRLSTNWKFRNYHGQSIAALLKRTLICKPYTRRAIVGLNVSHCAAHRCHNCLCLFVCELSQLPTAHWSREKSLFLSVERLTGFDSMQSDCNHVFAKRIILTQIAVATALIVGTSGYVNLI